MAFKIFVILGGCFYAGVFGWFFCLIGKEVEGLQKDSEDRIKRMRGEG